MSARPPTMQTLTDALLSRLSPRVAGMLQANARSRLMKRVDTVLMLYQDRVYQIGNGSWQSIRRDEGSDEGEQIAVAASALLDAREEPPSVLLLLPSTWFIATEVSMPGVAGENLRAALHLQSAVLLPSYESELAFAVNSASAQTDSPNIVLWTDAGKLNGLFTSFEEKGLFLAGVLPRALACADKDQSGLTAIQDEDGETFTSILCNAGVLTRFLQAPTQDMQDEAFSRQWRDESATVPSEATVQTFSDAQAYIDRGETMQGENAYCFVPEGALQFVQRAEKGRRTAMGIAAAVAVLIVGSLPFLWQSIQMMRLQSQLDTLQQASVQAREDQAAVRAFEQNWGVLNEYPSQNLPETLLQLQSVLSPSVLTSIEVDEGSVEIEGESQDPQSLLRQLEENSLFTGADFSRATNNNRYYIEFRLSTVDYDAYREWYFPDARR